jgi:hypothetical protein
MTHIRRWQCRARAVLMTLTMIVLPCAACARGEPKRLDPDEMFTTPIPDPSGMSFFVDSMYLVHLGAEEGAEYPVRVGVFYEGSEVPISPADVRAAIESAVADRPGARWELIAESVMFSEVVPSITVAIDLYPGGAVRGDLVQRCPRLGSRASGAGPGFNQIVTTREAFRERASMEAAVARMLSGAAMMRCPTVRYERGSLPARALP